jgi:hypothetical protein
MVAFRISRVDCVEKRAQLRIQRSAQPEIGQSSGESGQDQIRARIARHPFAIDASSARHGVKLFGWQPRNHSANTRAMTSKG